MALTAQATLNPSHPARSGMKFAFLSGVESSAGKIRNLVTGTEYAIALSNGAARGADATSPYIDLPTNAAKAVVTSTLTRSDTAFSFIVWVEPSTTAPGGTRPHFFGQIAGGGEVLATLRTSTAYDNLVSDVAGAGALGYGVAGVQGVVVGSYPLGVVYNGTNYTLYRPGAAPLVATTSPTPGNFTAASTSIAGSPDTNSSWPGRYRSLILWDGAVSAANMQAMIDERLAGVFLDPTPTSIVWDPTDAADTPTAIEVEIGAPETVRIEDQAGNPVADVAVVSADTAVYTVAPAITAADGLVTITALAPGVANLTGSRAGVANAVAAVTVPTTGSGGGEIPTAMPPTIDTTSPLPAVTAGTASSVSIAISGDGPFTLDVAAGALPAGLALPAGMPLPSPIALPWTGSAGGGTTASFTLRATGPDGAQDSKAFSLPINAAAAPAPTVTGVTFNPASPATIANGGTLQVTPIVNGANNPGQGGTWSKVSGVGSITQAGNVLTINAGTTAGAGQARFIPTADTEQSFEFAYTVQAAAPAGTRQANIVGLTMTAANAQTASVAANLTLRARVLSPALDTAPIATAVTEIAHVEVTTNAQGNAAVTGLPADTGRVSVILTPPDGSRAAVMHLDTVAS